MSGWTILLVMQALSTPSYYRERGQRSGGRDRGRINFNRSRPPLATLADHDHERAKRG